MWLLTVASVYLCPGAFGVVSSLLDATPRTIRIGYDPFSQMALNHWATELPSLFSVSSQRFWAVGRQLVGYGPWL